MLAFPLHLCFAPVVMGQCKWVVFPWVPCDEAMSFREMIKWVDWSHVHCTCTLLLAKHMCFLHANGLLMPVELSL